MATHDCNFAIFLSIQTKNAEMNIQIHVLQLFDGQQQQQQKVIKEYIINSRFTILKTNIRINLSTLYF